MTSTESKRIAIVTGANGVIGKAIASGYAPLAGLVVSEKISKGLAQGTGRFVHGLTYSGNPTSCFIGLKVLEIMQREGLFTRAAEIGSYLKTGLVRLAEHHHMIAQVRGRGLLYGLELASDRHTRTPFDASLNVSRRVVEGMRERGVVIAQGLAGSGDQIQISPPFTISEAEIDEVLLALDATISALEDGVHAPRPG